MSASPSQVPTHTVRRCLQFSTLLLVGFSCLIAEAADTAKPLDSEPLATRPLQQIDLVDFRGRTWQLDDFKDDSVLIVAVLGTECPLAKHYANRLQTIVDQYRDQKVGLIAVMSNRQDSLEEIASFANRQSIEYPVLKDAGNRFADQLGAERTPEVFVFDSARQLRYRGRVDDQFGISYTREAPRRHDLTVALDELLAGEPVSVPRTKAIGCIIGRAKAVDSDSEITYGSHIAQIMNRNCVSCHREGEIAPFPLTNYEDVAGWADMIAEVVREGRMPPWHATDQHAQFINDRTLTEAEREALFAWADAGAPAGDLTDLPPLPERLTGWQLPREPDLEFPISEVPVQIPATGTIDYKYFLVDPGFEEDVWVKAFEVKPGNREVVHHVLGFAVDKGVDRVGLQAALGFKFGHVPGSRVAVAPEGHAIKIPAGSQLLFQVHYIAVGTPQTDQSTVGIMLADPDEVTHEVIIASSFQLDIKIPPGASDHEVHSVGPRFPPGARLMGFNPHMHVRGKSFRYELEDPSGTRSVLMDVPNYDFNWQTAYLLSEMMPVPEGSRIVCDATFDNSEENLNNPDPNVWVRFGEQTWEEMMIGFYIFSVPRARAESGFTPTQIHKKNELRATLLMVFEMIDRDDDGKVSRKQMNGPLSLLFDQLNRDKDDTLTREEVDRELPWMLEMVFATLLKSGNI